MPTYRFQCEACGLNFTGRAAPDAATVPCRACEAPAARDLPRNVNAGLAAAPTASGAAPGATGYAGQDYNYDRAIGEDARAKWAMVAARQRDKVSYLQATGAVGKDLSRMPDGTYRVMPGTERVTKDAVRTGAFEQLAAEKAAAEKAAAEKASEGAGAAPRPRPDRARPAADAPIRWRP